MKVKSESARTRPQRENKSADLTDALQCASKNVRAGTHAGSHAITPRHHVTWLPRRTFVDLTFGAGGHTKHILAAAKGVRVFALDRDPAAFRRAQQMAKQYPAGQLVPLLGRFSELGPLLEHQGVSPGSLDGALVDCGCSSMQMDNPQRGFGLARQGPLDMRMDAARQALHWGSFTVFPGEPTAADVVNFLDYDSLVQVLKLYGEEKRAKKQQFEVNERSICGWRKQKKALFACSSQRKSFRGPKNGAFPDVERELTDFVQEQRAAHLAVNIELQQAKAREIARDKGIQPEDFKASKHWVSRFMRRAGFSLRWRTSISQKLPESYEEHLVAFQSRSSSSVDSLGRPSHPATKTFMALRILVNNELNELHWALSLLRWWLRPGARLAVLAFHSLEDRIVKRHFQARSF
ncbi:hypothetical protein HPB52_002944 [Rhipicephalus sanguineus]|uniref:HTH CENPB-type domain-containing protein n=1 Tax=Rhipicephalus sanguineus TaxID=34632 RepID=A0A9D4SPL4_RHISA|nr:hypothetical protein HPB52_002944 [Rhipicephalus sanguineus]